MEEPQSTQASAMDNARGRDTRCMLVGKIVKKQDEDKEGLASA